MTGRDILNRVKSRWTISRIIYSVFGVLIIVHAIGDGKYWGIIPGMYFASMGLFAFGCASGNCYNGNCEVPSEQQTKTE